jgi:hypothetical protein
MISGELYFKVNQSEIEDKFCETQPQREFVSFLSAHETHNSSRYAAKLGELQSIRSYMMRSLQEQRRHLHVGLLASVVNTYHETKAANVAKSIIMKERTSALRNDVDAQLMDLVLSYFDILKQEISFSRFSANADFSDINAQRKLAEINKKMKFFGLCIQLETSSKVQLTQFAPNSVQGKRCMKAVVDNLNPNMLHSLGFVSMEVNSVYKLDHALLNANLQVRCFLSFATDRVIESMCVVFRKRPQLCRVERSKECSVCYQLKIFATSARTEYPSSPSSKTRSSPMHNNQ